MEKSQTYIIKDENNKIIDINGRKSIYYGKLKDIVLLITLKEFMLMESLEVWNRADDKVKHRPIKKDKILKILKEC